jgi:hypothetical protein
MATVGVEEVTENALRAVARDCWSLSSECSDVAGDVQDVAEGHGIRSGRATDEASNEPDGDVTEGHGIRPGRARGQEIGTEGAGKFRPFTEGSPIDEAPDTEGHGIRSGRVSD